MHTEHGSKTEFWNNWTIDMDDMDERDLAILKLNSLRPSDAYMRQ